MSCDHAVWFPSKRQSNAEAGATYLALCEGHDAGLQEHPAIDRFYEELVAKHPQIDDIAEEDVDDTELCPWSIAFDRSPAHLIICCVWSRADCVHDLLQSLADKHGLAVYDPQAAQIHHPPGARLAEAGTADVKPWWKVW